MELIILGSGTCVPSLEHSAPSNFIRIANFSILVDCGPGTLTQLLKAGLDYRTIDVIFLTHFHTDHIAGLVPFIQALNRTPGFIRKKTLTLVGAKGWANYYKKYIKPIGGKSRSENYQITIVEIENNLNFPGFRVEVLKTQHTPESLAYKFSAGDISLMISGDCDYDENLVDFARGCDLILLECSFANDEKISGHLVPRECGHIAQAAQVGQLVLTHLYPPFPARQRLEEAKEIFPATVLAADLMKISL